MGQCLLMCTMIQYQQVSNLFPDFLPLKSWLSLILYLLSCFLLPDSEVLIPLIRKEEHAGKLPGSLAKVLVEYPELMYIMCQPGFF